MSEHTERNGKPLDESDETTAEGKVLPFRRPGTPQPTLTRRGGSKTPPANEPFLKKANSRKTSTSPLKDKIAQAAQILLLLAAFVLALKNCGKI